MQDMENGDDKAAPRPAPAVNNWAVGSTCVAVVAAAYLIAWLVLEPEPTARARSSYVTPPVAYPVQIPGCDDVEPPREARLFGVMYSVTDEYENPSYPWFSGPKAAAMTQALRDRLPGDAEIAFAPVSRSLVFQPILGDSTKNKEFGGYSEARATLLRGDRAGSLAVTVRQSDTPIPACVAGALDERRHLPDGTIVDTQDTWYEMNGVRTLSRGATGYSPDGSVVHAHATDDADDNGRTGAVTLAIDELVTLVTDPGLRVSAPVPPGTPGPAESCGLYAARSPAIDQAQARRWDAVLARIPLDGVTLDRPLGALLPEEWGGVCQVVRVNTPGRQSRLSITIRTGQPLPQDSSYDGATRRLPDGTVVETHEEPSAALASPPRNDRAVTVTRPSGTRIRVSFADAPAELLPLTQLEEIALDPGLEVSR